MKSRYDFMKDSNVKDVDGIPFPDVLSTNYSDFAITAIPSTHRVTVGDIQKFWLYMYNKYGVACYDDVLLNMNQIGYIGELEPGYKIYEFSKEDILNFNTNKRKEAD
jgi:hypothetical protein